MFRGCYRLGEFYFELTENIFVVFIVDIIGYLNVLTADAIGHPSLAVIIEFCLCRNRKLKYISRLVNTLILIALPFSLLSPMNVDPLLR